MKSSKPNVGNVTIYLPNDVAIVAEKPVKLVEKLNAELQALLDTLYDHLMLMPCFRELQRSKTPRAAPCFAALKRLLRSPSIKGLSPPA